MPAIGFGLLLGGGLANVVDRLVASPHRVTDFIAVSSFPVFNLADVAITLGFVILMVAALRGEPLLAR
jgi:signal peptidase II